MAAPSPLHSSHLDPLLLLHRAHILLYASFLLLLFHFHTRALLSSPSLPVFLLFASDLVLAFLWALTQAFRWRPLHRLEHPDRLIDRVGGLGGLPSLDVFICTADPHKEPPVGVANTALSVMGFENPPEKLSVYVSDDGGSDLTLFAFVEAARFARYWLPFCRENSIQERSPEVFFRRGDGRSKCPGYEKMEYMYQEMKGRVEKAVERGHLDDDDLLSMDRYSRIDTFKKWKNKGFHPKEHPPIIEVLLDSKRDTDMKGCPMPNFVYVSREKSAVSPHHFKAGALNALVRVSSVMTNAPVILTLDCDTVSNDPKAPQMALCYLHDRESNSNVAYVQFPQRFHNLNENDIYGGTFAELYIANPPGMDGFLGPNYLGSGTFFSRLALHNSNLMQKRTPLDSVEVLNDAHRVAGCTLEDGTKWGSTVGFRYGSLSEDYHTGLLLHCEGWRSVFCNPQRAAFLGDAPITLHDSLSQVRRWAVGLLEVAISDHCPLILGFKKSMILMGMCYAQNAFWPFWSFPLLTYATLPQIALLYKQPLFPKATDPSIIIYGYLFVAGYAKNLVDFLRVGGTCRRWWNDQRMWMIRGVTSFPLGLLEFFLKYLGFPGLGFKITSKVVDKDESSRYEQGMFEFGPTSPFLLSIGTIAIINLAAFVVGLVSSVWRLGDVAVQLMICGFVVVNCFPVYEAMIVRKDAGRVRLDCVLKCLLLAAILCVVGWCLFVV